MVVLRRILVVLAAFLAAGAAAAFVITFAMLMEWQEILAGTGTGAGWFFVGFFGLVVSAKALLPALLLIAVTEVLSIRSVLFYAAVGGAGLVALYHGLGLAEHDPLVGRDVEIMAGAGIAAGFVYWAIAGRNAGCWRGDVSSVGA